MKTRNNLKNKNKFPSFETIILTTNTIFSINLIPSFSSKPIPFSELSKKDLHLSLTDQQVIEVGEQATLISLLLDQLPD